MVPTHADVWISIKILVHNKSISQSAPNRISLVSLIVINMWKGVGRGMNLIVEYRNICQHPVLGWIQLRDPALHFLNKTNECLIFSWVIDFLRRKFFYKTVRKKIANTSSGLPEGHSLIKTIGASVLCDP